MPMCLRLCANEIKGNGLVEFSEILVGVLAAWSEIICLLYGLVHELL